MPLKKLKIQLLPLDLICIDFVGVSFQSIYIDHFVLMTFFIAEVSSNHSKDLDRCLEFIDCAAEIGCDAVKFQLFKITKLFAPEILKRSKKHRDRSQWELPLEFLPTLSKRCKKKKIQFGCTPFYLEAVNELEPFVDFYKIASYELLWNDLLIACAKTKKPVFISTGMANIIEIKKAATVLKENGCNDPQFFHCTSSYPTPSNQANLAAIQTLRNTLDCKIGWSDHTVEPTVISRAINKWGAEAVEFHLDLDGKGEEFSSGHCWLPEQIRDLIHSLSNGFIDDDLGMSVADGTGKKEPMESELADRLWRTDPSDGLRPFKEIRSTFKHQKS